MKVPYTTKTGLKIGSRYDNPPPQMTRDEELIQMTLLGLHQRHIPAWAIILMIVVGYLLVSCATRAMGI